MFREDGQEYAQVIKMLGNGRLEAQCFDGEKRLAHIRGKMRKKVRRLAFVRAHRFLTSRDGSSRSGLTTETLFSFLYEISKMTRRMSLSSIPPMRLVAVCSMFITRTKRSAFLTIHFYSESIWRIARKCQDQRDRDVRRGGGRVHIRIRRRRGSRHRRDLIVYTHTYLYLYSGVGAFFSSVTHVACTNAF